MLSVVGFIINCVALSTGFFTMIIALFILFKMIIYERRPKDIIFVAIGNTYLSLVFCSATLFSIGLNAFLGDIEYTIYQDSMGCRLLGYLFVPSLNCVINSFPLEALARFLIILHRQNSCLRSIPAMFVFIIVATACSVTIYVLGAPLYNLKYIPYEFNCSIDILAWKGMFYICILNNLVPTTITVMIYSVVLKRMRQSSQVVQNRQGTSNARDMYVIRRIMIIMFIAGQIGIPPTLTWIVAAIIGQLPPLAYRLNLVCFNFCMIFIAVGLALANPHIKSLLFRRTIRIRIYPISTMNKQKLPTASVIEQRQQQQQQGFTRP